MNDGWKTYKKGMFILGILLIGSEIAKQIILTIGEGAYDVYYFPFQLCSLPMYVCMVLGCIHSRKAEEICCGFLSDFCLLAGIAAFLDRSGFRYENPVLTAHSYLWHLLMIMIGIWSGIARSNTETESRGSFLFTETVFFVSCLIAEGFNALLGQYGVINLFYINPRYKMCQIVFADIAERIGNNAGILLYITAIAAGAAIMELFWQAVRRCRKDTLHRQRSSR